MNQEMDTSNNSPSTRIPQITMRRMNDLCKSKEAPARYIERGHDSGITLVLQIEESQQKSLPFCHFSDLQGQFSQA